MSEEEYSIKEIVGIRVDDCYMSLETLSEYSDLSKTTLKKLLKAPFDPIPAFQPVPGGKRLVKKSAFDAWMERHPLNPSEEDANVNHIVGEVMSDLGV